MLRLAFGPRVDRARLRLRSENGLGRHQKRQAARAGAGGIRCFPDRRPQLEFPTEHHQIDARPILDGKSIV